MVSTLVARSVACVTSVRFGMALRGSTVDGTASQCNSQCNNLHWKWDISPIIYLNKPVNYAVVLLNTPITQSQRFFTNLWNNANLRISVDGGTKKLEDFLSTCTPETQTNMKLPDILTGDFDSIKQDVLEKYRKKGCKVVHTPDQNSTDFTKALVELTTHCQETDTEVDHVVAIAQSSRRIDQIFGNVETMFLARERKLLSPNSRLYLISDDAISWLLYPGGHSIAIPEESRSHPRAWCSLVPIGEPCVSVTSSGLKWNLDNHTLGFGKLVSTSNTFTESDTVTVECSHTLLWSMKLYIVQDEKDDCTLWVLDCH